jgi:hypothetical protein
MKAFFKETVVWLLLSVSLIVGILGAMGFYKTLGEFRNGPQPSLFAALFIFLCMFVLSITAVRRIVIWVIHSKILKGTQQ